MTLKQMPMGWYCQLWSQRNGARDIYNDYGDKLWKRAYGRLNAKQKAAMDQAYNTENQAFLKANLKGRDLVRWKYQRTMKNYLACIKSIDDNVGRLMAYMDKTGLTDDTLIIYASDQGLFLGEHGWYDKRFMYEEAFRTPLIAYSPSYIPPHQVSDELVQNIDYAPTILDYAGVSVPKDMQGVSLMPLMRGDKIKHWRKSLYYHYYEYPRGHQIQKHEGVATSRYKLIHFYNIGEWEFYDLKNDPHEMKSEYGNPKYRTTIKNLKQELNRLRKAYKVPPLK